MQTQMPPEQLKPEHHQYPEEADSVVPHLRRFPGKENRERTHQNIPKSGYLRTARWTEVPDLGLRHSAAHPDAKRLPPNDSKQGFHQFLEYQDTVNYY